MISNPQDTAQDAAQDAAQDDPSPLAQLLGPSLLAKDRNSPFTNDSHRWFGVVCDNCHDDDFEGTRHRCQTCNDYDLCDSCFQDNPQIHAEHPVFEVPKPQAYHSELTSTSAALAGKVVFLFFGAYWCGPARAMTTKLIDFYHNLLGKGTKTEIVYVSSDHDQASFEEFYLEMPWLAVPFEQLDFRKTLTKKFNVKNIPRLLILDERAEIIRRNPVVEIYSDLHGERFPYIPKTFHQILDRPLATREGRELSFADLKGKILGLLFAASWSGPCQSFVTDLVSVYEKLKTQHQDFEVIFISSDREEEHYQKLLAKMPWLALSRMEGAEALIEFGELYTIDGIPQLVIVDSDGNVINRDAVASIHADPEGANFPWVPKRLCDISESFSSAGYTPSEKTSLILFSESASQTEQDALERAMLSIVGEYSSPKDGRKLSISSQFVEPSVIFFTGKAVTPVSTNVRQMVSLPYDEAKGPQALLLDIPNEKYHVYEGSISEDSLRNLLSSYQNGTLDMTPLQA
ncbi:thioredoxin-like-domain-containing protein [Polychytrium aggregatum]|uniref:thioredoxin-like-domain-containing protein n=1 Tax=Polychytrium aggregatum TaxID=110093 RepID=UPI0022FE9B0C|nr:thioredoxin-like-domain-containing protein [Polychytrium aggregatum]KAI9193671.1 thioredoxin-like-domain-containing protein [Polychytrium aggregatum]